MGNKLLLDGARETLVLLGIVVLKTNLKLDSFQEISFLVSRLLQDGANGLKKGITRYFGPEIQRKELDGI